MHKFSVRKDFYMTRSISEKIKELRQARGLTQEGLGELCGVSGQAISKWEKGDSLPDIMLLPRLCEILGITADALLEVPAGVQQKNCMEGLFEYAKATDEWRAAYEAVCATSYPADREYGTARMSMKGIKLHNIGGVGLVIAGHEMMQRIKEIDPESIRSMTRLITDENALAVIRVLDFGAFLSEQEIADKTGLALEAVENTIFKLLKQGICECDADGKYVFGSKAYIIFALLSGFYLASKKGYDGIGTISCSYNP